MRRGTIFVLFTSPPPTSHLNTIKCPGFYSRSQNCEKRLLGSYCLSVRPHGTTRLPLNGFSWNLVCEDFSKLWRENISLKSDKNNGHFTWGLIYIFIISRSFILIMRSVSENSCTGYQNTFLSSETFFFENRTIHEKMWKNIVEPGRPQITVWRLRITCWIPKATNTHTHNM